MEVGFTQRPIYSQKYKIIKIEGIRHYKIRTTDARSAKKDVTSTKPQKASGVERTFPREEKKTKLNPNLLPWFPPPNAAVLGACYPV